MTGQRTILITGATGKQGGSIVRAMLGKGFRLRALTRNPDSEAAHAVAALGVEMVKGDLDHPHLVEQALAGAWGAFAVQNTWEHGVEREEEQGVRFARLAHHAGVHHFVYSSVGSAHRDTGIPHFENKSRVERVVRALKFPSHVILRPVFFMENLLTPSFLHGDTLISAMDPATSLQMIAVEDIGWFGARAFTDAAKLNGRELDIAGDSRTMPESAAILSKGLGRHIEYVRIPMSEVRMHSEDVALMLEWFDRIGYDADIPALEREFGFKPTTLAGWIAKPRA
jgi:uncharacterized protein YbjT (DUF2867 family)